MGKQCPQGQGAVGRVSIDRAHFEAHEENCQPECPAGLTGGHLKVFSSQPSVTVPNLITSPALNYSCCKLPEGGASRTFWIQDVQL